MEDLIIIRPSGIWNTRAPFSLYIINRKKLSRTSRVLELSLYWSRELARDNKSNYSSVRQMMKKTVKQLKGAGDAAEHYRRSFYRDERGNFPQVHPTQFAIDAAEALYDVRQMTVVRLASLFELFAQSWALNYLAAKIETGMALEKSEVQLIRAFNPFKGSISGQGWPNIAASIEFLSRDMAKHKFTQKGIQNCSSSNAIDSLELIRFWRAYRNKYIHSGGIVSQAFYDRYSTLFNHLCTSARIAATLKVGAPLPIPAQIYEQMAQVQYNLANEMNEYLFSLSAGRRGHPEAPHPRTIQTFSGPAQSIPLFVDGDHPASYKWTIEQDFRDIIIRERGYDKIQK